MPQDPAVQYWLSVHQIEILTTGWLLLILPSHPETVVNGGVWNGRIWAPYWGPELIEGQRGAMKWCLRIAPEDLGAIQAGLYVRVTDLS